MTDTNQQKTQTTRRRAVRQFLSIVSLVAVAVAGVVFADTLKILGTSGRDWVNDALEGFTGRNGPVSVSQQRLLTSADAYVTADLRRGDRAPADGCSALENLPAAWDAVPPDSEVYMKVSPTRDDVVLVGFELTKIERRNLGRRTIVTCEGGGNGAPSGFKVTDTAKEGAVVTPVGPGSQTGKMRLFLSPGEDYILAVWFSTKTQQITSWSGELIFEYGNDGSQTHRLPVGPATTAGKPKNARTLTIHGGRWR